MAASKYNKNLLDLLVSCLEEKAEKRIDFTTLYQKFVEIEKLKYFDERILNKLYLSEEPICFASYKNSDNDAESLLKLDDYLFKDAINPFSGIDFEKELKRSEQNRLTAIFRNCFASKKITDMEATWKRI